MTNEGIREVFFNADGQVAVVDRKGKPMWLSPATFNEVDVLSPPFIVV